MISKKREKSFILELVHNYSGESDLKLLNDEVMILGAENMKVQNEINDDDYEWIKVNGINDVLDVGYSKPDKAFSSYFKINHNKINNLILTFTIDDYFIFGMSLDDTDDNLIYSKNFLSESKMKYNFLSGAIFLEQIPA
ncbi:MAG: hypothetical protein JXR48_10650, partial [Candidatus Delongbacteria bacterium]|nr:hypothetical protein [Candidatus Delongbacteria bacterium]